MRLNVLLFLVALLLISTNVYAQVDAKVSDNVVEKSIGIQEIPQGKEMALPHWGIKTNLLYDITSSMNLGLEFRLSKKTSLDISGNYNPWTFRANRKWAHLLAQPEFRWWPKETFSGHFLGLHGHYAYYNVGNLPGFMFSENMKEHRFAGDLYGGGLSYGYRWNFNHRLAIEATIGAGYVYMDYDKYQCENCGDLIGSRKQSYFGPTKVGISLIMGIGGKPAEKPVYTVVVPPAPVIVPPVPVVVPPTPYNPVFTVSFIVPEVELLKARNISGKAYLDFAVGRSDVVSGFRNNAAELQKIHKMIEAVKNDPDATITGITITGYASPEGTWASNLALSDRRVQALKDHVMNIHGLRSDMFRVWGAGEDWAGLDSAIVQSNIQEKYSILEIVRSAENADVRERKLTQIASGVPYRQIKAEIFPQLRRSDYNISYTVVPFTIERGKEVLRTNPRNLSLNEMFLIADTYPSGSDAYKEVFEIAARVHPGSDVANINAAAIALNNKNATLAAQHLTKVKEHTSSAYWNNAGILAWFEGDTERAMTYFEKAGTEALANAAEMRKYIESINK